MDSVIIEDADTHNEARNIEEAGFFLSVSINENYGDVPASTPTNFVQLRPVGPLHPWA